MYREIEFTDFSKEMLEQLQKGAFLTVRKGGRVNTMTIAWGSLGFMWKMPVFTVMVRYSRYTYELIKDASEFTVSLPLKGQLKEELNICGTKSGRDMDKFKECNLDTMEGRAVDVPVIAGCDLHVECEVVYKQEMIPENLNDEIKSNCYSQKDYHVLYYGKIRKMYIRCQGDGSVDTLPS